jgi:integrase/recombinase XerD
MARRRALEAWAGDLNDPEGLVVWARRYLEYMQVRHFRPTTVVTTEGHLRIFIRWATDRGLSRPVQITKPMIEAHQRWLFYYRKQSGKPLSVGTQRTRLQLLKGWFRWLARENVILWNPASEIEMPRMERKLPRAILSEREIEQVFAQADITDALGLRDRAMMEVLYSTGIRRAELSALGLYDIDADRGVVTVRLGKGRKDRTIPIGERALHWVGRYLDEVRPSLVVPPDHKTVFLTENGDPIALATLSYTMSDYLRAANLGKQGAVHIFRHTMATHLLDAGADIRAIQEILGHVKLSTTEIYTHVSIQRLKLVHDTCHPAAKLVPRARDALASEDATTEQSDAAAQAAAELELALVAEAADEDRGDDA